MTGYVRVDTGNNIADGNVINAADLDNEFNGVQSAFNSSTGHTHDGTSGEGAPILKIGPVQDVVVSATAIYPKTTNTIDLGTGSLKYKDLFLSGNSLLGGTLGVTGVATFTAQPILSSLTASRAVFSDASKGLVSNAITGTGDVVMSNSPTLVTPVLGTPTSGNFSTGTFTWPTFNQNTTGNAATATTATNVSGGTASVTTLTTSSTVTLNGGTANGVAYLNGSKVLTTGSALTFDGSTFTAEGLVDVDGVSGSPLLRLRQTTAGAGTEFNTTITENTGVTFDCTDSGTTARSFIWSQVGSEQMRLTSTGLGIGTSSPNLSGYNEEITVSAGTSGTARAGINIQGSRTTDSTFGALSYYHQANLVGSIEMIRGGADNSGAMQFFTSNAGTLAERMRIDTSGNVGIGGTSDMVGLAVQTPSYTTAYAADLSGNAAVAGYGSQLQIVSPSDTSTVSGLSLFTRTTGRSRWDILNVWTGTYLGDLVFRYRSGGTSNAEAMRINSSGNLGLGVTPSAWQSGRKALQVGNASINSYSTSQNQLGANFYYDGTNNKYISSDFSTVYQQLSGQHQWYTSASGTAGSNIAFTQAMTLDASGNLMLGTPSTSAKLEVNVTGTASYSPSAAPTANILLATSGSANSRYTSIGIGSRGTAGQGQTNYISSIPEATDGYSSMTFSTYGNYAVAERMRIDSSGRLGVGTTSPAAPVHAKGATIPIICQSTSTGAGPNYLKFTDSASTDLGYIGYGGASKELYFANYSADPIVFYAGAERARIASTGELLVGGTVGVFDSPGSIVVSRSTGGKLSLLRNDASVVSGDNIGSIEFSSIDNSLAIPRSVAYISVSSSGTFAANNTPSYITFGTTPASSETAVERVRIDSTGQMSTTNGAGSVALAYDARAWVNFNGTGTVAIRGSGNVSSITDNNTGYYTVNFSTAMTDTVYNVVGAAKAADSTATTNNSMMVCPFSYATGSVNIYTIRGSDTLNDSAVINVSVFR